MCHKIDITSNKIQVLIIVPTRELALQYAEEAQKIGRFKKVSVFAIFGGEDMDLQRAKLKNGVHILVATPGRLIDFIYSRAIELTHVKALVLDEADQMLSLGFYEDLEFVMNCLMQEHQTLLFSATMPTEIKKIAREHMETPFEITLIADKPAPTHLTHQFFLCKSLQNKYTDIIRLLKNVEPRQCLLFANSRHEVERLTRELKKNFPSVDFLHGGLDQRLRMTITSKFSRGKIRYLVATDVASRGLDFSLVTHVINVQMPLENETYMHRSGRTARAGRKGICITFVTSREKARVTALCQQLAKEPEWL
jgi:ATP-dependent RNA helicase DeaD